MDSLHLYTIEYDTGFAPNYGRTDCPYCTLACCGSRVRRDLGAKYHGKDIKSLGIWVAGLAGKTYCNIFTSHAYKTPVYLMRVEEILTFDEYYNDQRFLAKRPSENNEFGDNYYHDGIVKPNKNFKHQDEKE